MQTPHPPPPPLAGHAVVTPETHDPSATRQLDAQICAARMRWLIDGTNNVIASLDAAASCSHGPLRAVADVQQSPQYQCSATGCRLVWSCCTDNLAGLLFICKVYQRTVPLSEHVGILCTGDLQRSRRISKCTTTPSGADSASGIALSAVLKQPSTVSVCV